MCGCADGRSHRCGGKHIRMTPMTVVSANMATRLSVPLLKHGYAKDNEPKSSNACLMTRVQTSLPYMSTRSKRLDSKRLLLKHTVVGAKVVLSVASFLMLNANATGDVACCARCENLSFTLPFDPRRGRALLTP